MPDTTEDIVSLFSIIAPIWREDIWNALQDGNFDEAEKYLKDSLSALTAQDWETVHWMGMIEGAPALRGDIDSATWTAQALPAIGRAIILAATPSKLSSAYSSMLNVGSLMKFHALLLSSIPGATSEDRHNWISANAPTLLNYFLASPLGLHFANPPSFSATQIARFEIAPEGIRSALFSIQTPEIIKIVTEQNNIPDGKVEKIADAAGMVLFGFLHPEELTNEVTKNTGIPPESAKSVSDSLNSRIFQPIQSDLAKFYAPLLHDHELNHLAPTIIEQAAPSAPSLAMKTSAAPVTTPRPAPQTFSQTASDLSIGAAPLASNKDTPAPAPQPAKPNNSGWSKETQDEPVVQLGAITAQIPTAPSSIVAPQTQKPPTFPATPAPGTKIMSEFERLDAMKRQPGTTPPNTPAAQPAPVMFHEVSNVAASQQSADFHFAVPSTQNQINNAVPPHPAAPKPAVLEFGGATPTPPTHYTDYKPAQAPTPTPTPSNTPRQITELTSRMPLNPQTPTPAQTPSPTPTPGKVIIKDFLGPQR